MPLVDLAHVNIRTARLREMIAFYEDVLGMRRGPRPGFSFAGAWLYLGDKPFVHLVEVDAAPEPGSSLKLEHFAFNAVGLRDFLAYLDRVKVPYRIGRLEDFGVVQVNVQDPDGNHIHVDFDARRNA